MQRQLDGHTSLFITGSEKILTHVAYRQGSSHKKLQGDRFRPRSMLNYYDELELHLMLLCQGGRSTSPAIRRRDPLGTADAGNNDTSVVSAEDVVLALAYRLYDIETKTHGHAWAGRAEWWRRVGYLVQPSLPQVVDQLQGGHRVASLPTNSDRLTIEQVKTYLSDENTLDAASKARSKVLRAWMRNGVLARNLKDLSSVQYPFKQYVAAVYSRHTTLSRFCVAMVRVMLDGRGAHEVNLIK